MGTAALFLGAFVLALAALSKFYMYDQLAVVPLNNQSTNISSTQQGDNATYLDAAAGLKVTDGPLKNTKVVTGDVKASKQASKDTGRDVAVWNIYDCTDKPSFNCGSGKVALSAITDTVAFDRNTGEAVSWKGSSNNSDGKAIAPAAFQGLYFKFPFDAQKKTYPFWDGTLKKSTPAKYVGQTTVKGMKAYEYKQAIAPIKTGTIDVPGSLVGSDAATVTADQVYSSVSTYEVDPVTGVILDGKTAQDAYLELDGQRVLTTTKATIGYTDATVTSTVDEYKSKASLLTAVKTWIPVGGTILGLVLIGLGVASRVRGGRAGNRKADDKELVGSR